MPSGTREMTALQLREEDMDVTSSVTCPLHVLFYRVTSGCVRFLVCVVSEFVSQCSPKTWVFSDSPVYAILSKEKNQKNGYQTGLLHIFILQDSSFFSQYPWVWKVTKFWKQGLGFSTTEARRASILFSFVLDLLWLGHRSANFSVKGHKQIFHGVFLGHMVSGAFTKLCHCNIKQP